MTMSKKPAKRSIPAGEFKATCLALLDEVARTRQPLMVTKRGRPVAQIIPVDGEPAKPLLGSVVYEGDIVSATGELWNADES